MVRSLVMRPRFSYIARIASALRWMLGVSLARFGIERSSANSARISRSWFARQAREFFATVPGSALSVVLSMTKNSARTNLILECCPIRMKPNEKKMNHAADMAAGSKLRVELRTSL